MTLMDRILAEGVKPHAEEIARIGLTGAIVCVVFEPGDDWKHKALPKWGWRGEPVFRLSRRARAQLSTADPVTRRWIERAWDGETLRIFLAVQRGSFLVNFKPGEGFSLEPGSTDAELAAWRGSLN